MDFEHLLQHVPAVVYAHSLDGKVLYGNDRWMELLGFEEPPEFPVDLEDLLGKERAAYFMGQDRRVIEDGEHISLEEVFTGADGVRRTFLSNKFPTTLLNGTIASAGVAVDITDQAKVNRELQASEARFAAILEGFPATVYVNGGDKQAYFGNARWKRGGGLDDDVEFPVPFSAFMPEAFHDHFNDQDRQVIETGQSITEEEAYPDGEGGTIHYLSTKFPIPLDQDTVASGGIAIDITELKRAQQAVTESEARMSAILEQMPGPVFIQDKDHMVRYANSEWKRTVGAPQDLALPSPMADHFPPELLTELIAQDDQVMGSGAPTRTEDEVTAEDGSSVHFITHKFPVPFEGGVASGGIALDVTDLKRAQEAAAQAQVRLERMLEATPTPLIITRVSDGMVVFANQASLANLHLRREDVIGKPSVVRYADPADRERLFAQMAAEGSVSNMIVPLLDAEGVSRRFSLSVHPIELDGEPHVIASSVDVEELELAKAEAADARSRLEAILSSLPTPMIITRLADGVVAYANQPCAELLGYPVEEMVDHVAKDFYWEPADRADVIEALRADGQVTDYRLRIKDGAGQMHWILLTAQIRPLDGEPHIVTALIDITEVEAAQQAVEAERVRFEALFESTPVGLVEEDFTAVRARLDSLVAAGEDVVAWLEDDDHVRALAAMVEVHHINGTAQRMYGLKDATQLKGAASVGLGEMAISRFRDQVTALWSGERHWQGEAPQTARDGRALWSVVDVTVVTGHEQDWHRVLVAITDITERKAAEEELERAQWALGERVKELRGLNDLADAARDLTRAKPEVFQTLIDVIPPAWQYPEDTVARVHFGDIVVASEGFQRTPWVLERDILVDGQAEGHVEICYLSEHPAMDVGPWLNEELELLEAMTNVLGDFVSRKRAMMKVEESQERLDLAVRAAGIGLWDWHIPTDRVVYNGEWARIVGRWLGELEQNVDTWTRHVHPEDLEAAFASVQVHLEDPSRPHEAQYRMLHSSGREIWVQDRGQVVERAPDGAPVRMIGTLLDMTERKRWEEGLIEAQAEAERARERSDLAVSASGLGIWDWEFEPGVLTWNEEFMSMLGRPIDEYPFHIDTWLELLHPDDIGPAGEVVEAHRADPEGTPYLNHFRMRHADGRWVPIQSRGKVVLPADGSEPVRMMGTHLDLTDRKRWEAGLLEAQKAAELAMQAAEEASLAKSSFLATMSHELRTPMNAIIGFSEILEDGAFGELNAKQARYIGNVLSSARHLLSLINDILDLSKIEAGKLELDLRPLPVGDLCTRVYESVGPLADKKGHSVALELDDGMPALLADNGKITQVVYNLMSNSIKYTEDGGHITLAAVHHPDGFADRVSGPAIEISVADDGIGLTTEDLERVFGRFEQVDAGYAREQEGTGLGLNLTRELVRLHGGEIWAESEGAGAGSTFRIVLPLAGPDQVMGTSDGDEANAADDPDDQRPLILIVEDEPAARELLAARLAEAGYRTLEAPSSRDAVQYAREHQPSAITLDLIMPGMGGWEVLDALKAEERTRDIPVIIVSTIDDVAEGARHGAVDFLVKPVNKDALIEAIGRALDQGRRPRVLAIDDEAKVRELLHDVVEGQGWDVIEATGGADGVEKILEERPDLIVLDLMMPDVTGFDVVERVRQVVKDQDIPVVVYSAKDVSQDERAQLGDAVTTILRKADGTQDLIVTLRELLESDTKERAE